MSFNDAGTSLKIDKVVAVNVESESAPSSAPPTVARLPREVWMLVAVSFVIAVGFGIVAPALPTFARSFNVSVTAVV